MKNYITVTTETGRNSYTDTECAVVEFEPITKTDEACERCERVAPLNKSFECEHCYMQHPKVWITGPDGELYEAKVY